MRFPLAVAVAGFVLALMPRAALEAKDVSAVLKWVRPADEAEVREAFRRTLVVRGAGGAAAALADRFFFETLVRVHRAGEGVAFTGLQPAGAAIDAGIAATDAALQSGSADALVRLVAGDVEKGLRTRYARAAALRAHAGESVARGREYVATYVDLMHYAERLVQAAAGGAHGEPAEHAH